MKTKVFGLVIIVLLVKCTYQKNSTEKKFFDFNNEVIPVNILHFEHSCDFNTTYDSFRIQNFIVADSTYVVANSKMNSSLLILRDIKNNTESKLNLHMDLTHVMNFKYISNDSIFLHINNWNNDSCMMLVDAQGQIKRVYSFKNAPVYSVENPQYTVDDPPANVSFNYLEDFPYKDGKIYLVFEPWNSLFNSKKKNMNIPLAGYIDTKSNTFHEINIHYPDLSENDYYYSANAEIFCTFAHDGDILYGFKHSPTIIKYNPKTKVQKTIRLKSTIFDTIYPANSEKDIPKGFNMPYHEYYHIKYDPYRKMYFRFINMPSDFGKYKFSIMVADTNFHLIGEGFLPEQSGSLYFTKDYLINQHASYSGNTIDKIVFSEYKLSFRKGTNQELISAVKKLKISKKKTTDKPLTHYVKTFGKTDSDNYCAIFMWVDETCPGVNDYIFQLFHANKGFYDKADIYLFVIATDSKKLRKALDTKYLLSSDNTKNIKIDSVMTFAPYVNYEVNMLPRIIKVRNKKIVTDTIFSIDDDGLEKQLQFFLIDAGNEQLKMKKK
jgi:hypothetical protein